MILAVHRSGFGTANWLGQVSKAGYSLAGGDLPGSETVSKTRCHRLCHTNSRDEREEGTRKKGKRKEGREAGKGETKVSNWHALLGITKDQTCAGLST